MTRDGTGERDFIHIVDLAKGHVQSVAKIDELARFQTINLGTGVGTTVLELIKSFEEVNSVKIPIRIVQRRQGDVDKSIADPTISSKLINFSCEKTIRDMCADTWNWQIRNPSGFIK